MNKRYNLKLDLQFRCNNSIMKFNQFDNNTSDFFMRITNGGKLVDIEKAIVVLAAIKPSGKVASQFVEVENGLVYADLKASMKDEIGIYTAQAMLILEDERIVTEAIAYEVEEDKIFSLLNDSVEATEEFTLLTDMLSRLSTIEISEEQRVINEAERILSEENRKIEEAKRVEAELIRQHEEADRAKYDATRESNENIRKINEEARISSENVRLENEANRIEQEANRVKAEQLRKDNYNFMTEDEERRRLEANAHKEAEVLRVQAETNRVNEEAKRRTTEQARVSAENTRVGNENTREANETTRQTNEAKRVEAETQRQSRYNSFITDAEANANNFENYTNTVKVKEEERKSNELDRKSQEDRRVSNEVERISNENTRKANEVVREKNETSRQNIFENKVNEVDEKIVEIDTAKDNFVSSINTKVDNKISELNTTKDNFVSSVNTKIDNKISEIDNAKSDMTNTVSNKVNEVETRFNALTSSQQQDAEVVDARDGETSLKARLDRDIEKANKELDKIKKLEESTVSTVTTESDFTTVEATSNGYFEDVKLEGKTLVNLFKNVNWVENVSSYIYTENVLYNPVGETVTFINLSNKQIEFAINDSDVLGIHGNYVDSIYIDAFSTKVIKIPNGCGIRRIVAKYKDGWTADDITAIKNKTILLKGAYPNICLPYFEGLKSVGQSATTSEGGVDEISVESVNENLIPTPTYRLDIPVGTQTNNYANTIICKNIPIKPNTTYRVSCGEYINKGSIKGYPLRCMTFRDKYDGNNVHVSAYTHKNRIKENETQIFTTEADAKYLVITIGNFASVGNIEITELCLTESSVEKPYTPHQSDKKRLLYYNEETQTWEKPILREWDSIEKHTDGKYYYHKRSGEVVLNGSENWNNDKNSSTISPETYRQSIQFNAIDIPSASFNTKTSPNIISDLLPTVTFGDVYSYNHIGISISGTDSIGTHIIINNNFIDVTELKQWLQANNLTVVYQLAEEKVYECTNIDLITYNGETNFIVESGVLSPKTTLKVHSNISNVVSLLQKKVSLLESNMTKYMITQNRLMLASRYNADTVSFKVDVASFSDTFEYDNDLYELILNNILVGKDNYNREYIENLIRFYWMDFIISDEMYSTLFEIIKEQHNPKIEEEEETPLI